MRAVQLSLCVSFTAQYAIPHAAPTTSYRAAWSTQ
jgi:hypothetical protein